MKKTEELLKTIQSCKNYQDFISESRQELISVRKLGEAFQEILTQKKLKKSDVIRNSGIDRGYPMLYARIARDSAIIFAFRHHMSPIDTNELLYELQFDLLS